ncbi:uncharacterized protein LOC110685755 [Chenopodium quinoa]|uniref:BSD domain-containing protein n=1 Tax=Chenopodium quinoa TaxID=63459 RepID=A0A803L6P4_CHEQI|nr:uncharacterized protein LOC110685755 [Chenopodium quinoa]
MSWLTSIANSLKLDDYEEEDDATTTNSRENQPFRPQNPNNGDDQQINTRNTDSADSSSPSDHQTTTPRGVKDDLSEFSKTLTRQLWGVASFLAPPPPSQISDRDPQIDDYDPDTGDLAGITGIRNDLSEIGGRFRSGISKLSTNKAVSEFSKIASNILQFASEEDLSIEDYAKRGVVGATEEVVAFARDVAMHPETWIDFPLPDDDEDEDFDLSDAQQEHALAVERLAPELAALRTELCLGYMNEGSFWKIYFVLVHPRLSRQDAEILATPQIMRARAMLTQELHTPGKSSSYDSKSGKESVNATELSHEEHLSVPVADTTEYIPVEISAVDPASSAVEDVEIDKHPITSTEIPVIDKAVVGEVNKKTIDSEEPTSNTNKSNVDVAEEVSKKQMDINKPTPAISKSIDQKDEEDVDDWLKEDSTEGGSFKGTSYQVGNDDDVSFSDLEEDDDVPTSYKKSGNENSFAKESSDWIQLSSRSSDSSKDSNAKSVNRSGSNTANAHKNKESNDWLDVEDIDDA